MGQAVSLPLLLLMPLLAVSPYGADRAAGPVRQDRQPYLFRFPLSLSETTMPTPQFSLIRSWAERKLQDLFPTSSVSIVIEYDHDGDNGHCGDHDHYGVVVAPSGQEFQLYFHADLSLSQPVLMPVACLDDLMSRFPAKA